MPWPEAIRQRGLTYGARFVAAYLLEQYGLLATWAKLVALVRLQLLGAFALSESRRAVRDSLRTFGVAKTSCAEYHGSEWDFQGVVDEVRDIVSGKTPAEMSRDFSAPKDINQYNFNRFAAPKCEAFFREMLDVATHFYGEEAMLQFVQIRHTMTDTTGSYKKDAIRAASWHVDHEGFHVLKVFVNITDVNASNGPLRYLLRSHFGNPLNARCHELMHDGRRRKVVPDKDSVCVTDEELFASFDDSQLATNEGPPGTITYVDTSGTHKGGFSDQARTVLIACFMPTRKFRVPLPWQV